MLKIRLARIGKKKKPLYRIIVSEGARDTYGSFLEILGAYNPVSKVCEVKKDRILHWMKNGAKPSPTVHNLLVEQNVITDKKVRACSPKKKEKPAEEAQAESKPVVAEQPNPSAPVQPEVKTEVVVEEKKEEPAEVKPEVPTTPPAEN